MCAMPEHLKLSEIHLRPNQREIMEYRFGKMGISAVPGSGKTWTLSLLAAEIVARGELADDQEVLVVTLVNSAVNNFYQRVGEFVTGSDLLPNMGYRVRTLHGLAHDIVRMRPDLAGLSDSFQIIDDREVTAILKDATRVWLAGHPYDLDEYLNADLNDNRREWVRRDKLPDLVASIASNLIRYAKDKRLTPELLGEKIRQMSLPLPLAQLGAEIYSEYQRALAYRAAVDFDDLIRLALDSLEADSEFLERLREKWPYILEDEAQDSSRLQEEILKLLAGESGNWVRVGDPNQAIYETFTTADPKYLRKFIERRDVERAELPESGRSTQSIINLANYLVKWTSEKHPLEAVRDALHDTPKIKATSEDDPDPNPEDNLSHIELVAQKMTPEEEMTYVVDSLEVWLQKKENQKKTVAVLVARNQRGFDLVDELKRRDIEYVDSQLRSSSSTRSSAGVLGNLLNYLAHPSSAGKLATIYRVWRRADLKDAEKKEDVEAIAKRLRKIKRIEDFIWPTYEYDWLRQLEDETDDKEMLASLRTFRDQVRRWQAAVQLPVDQLLLTLSQDLLNEQSDLALAHKLAVLLRQASQIHPDWRLPEMKDELAEIAKNERRFLGFSEDDLGFNPKKHKGKVVVSTMHKAKGLEWQRVYIMAVNNYNFPSGAKKDKYLAERWFLRDELNLEAEALAQFNALFDTDEYRSYESGPASRAARLDYVRERLRLFYVCITRAKEELIVTWNTGRKGELEPSEPFEALMQFWNDNSNRE